MVSILMSTYNEPLSFIKQSVESIENQNYREIEIIIVVDNPTNRDLIKFLENVSENNSQIKLVINEKNLGLTGSLNKALQFASGDYIARMDADDISKPDRLKKQLDFLKKRKLDLVGCNIQNIDENGITSDRITIYPETPDKVAKYARYDSPVAHPSWLVKREVFESLNGYQEIDACEDYDFIVRAILNGFKIGNIQEPLLNYRINTQGISSTKKSKQKATLYYIRNNYRKGKISTAQDIFSFLGSSDGIKKIHALDEYYSETSKIKKAIGIKKFIMGINILLLSHEARSVLKKSIIEKIITWN